jgi:tRNA(fMet)-specific endonuclease VapC
MPIYMLDTDTASYIMKRSNRVVLDKLRTIAVTDLSISAITKSELMFGVEISPRRQKDQASLDEFLDYAQVLDYPSEAALDYGQIRAYVKARGAIIGSNDMLIAAHARCLGLTLVTNNTREFARVPQLKIENWTEPSP